MNWVKPNKKIELGYDWIGLGNYYNITWQNYYKFLALLQIKLPKSIKKKKVKFKLSWVTPKKNWVGLGNFYNNYGKKYCKFPALMWTN